MFKKVKKFINWYIDKLCKSNTLIPTGMIPAV